MFTPSVVLLHLEAPGAYPMLLGRPWLRTDNIKQHWQRNMISFRCGKTKVRIVTEESLKTPHNTTAFYVEGVHMLNGLAEEEVDDFVEDYPTMTPLFEIDAIKYSEVTSAILTEAARKKSFAKHSVDEAYIVQGWTDRSNNRGRSSSRPPNNQRSRSKSQDNRICNYC